MTVGVGADNARWVRSFGDASDGAFAVSVTDAVDGWQHTSLRVAHLDPGGSLSHHTGDEELVVVPLAGSVAIDIEGGETILLHGRASVFDGPSDTAYLPRQRSITVRDSGTGARVALCGARATTDREPRRIAADEAGAELRGAGRASREVRAFGLPPTLHADAILVCEVITPAGNWSSWPPHKHDEDRPGVESELEEIYYFETRSTDSRGTDPVGYQRVYGTDDATDRRPRRGPHRRRRPRAARLARTGDGRPGRRPLLPQRHGRAGHRAGLAHLRRPRARLGA